MPFLFAKIKAWNFQAFINLFDYFFKKEQPLFLLDFLLLDEEQPGAFVFPQPLAFCDLLAESETLLELFCWFLFS